MPIPCVFLQKGEVRDILRSVQQLNLQGLGGLEKSTRKIGVLERNPEMNKNLNTIFSSKDFLYGLFCGLCG